MQSEILSVKIRLKKGLEKGAIGYSVSTELRTLVNLIPGLKILTLLRLDSLKSIIITSHYPP
jgi:hypothetical protein